MCIFVRKRGHHFEDEVEQDILATRTTGKGGQRMEFKCQEAAAFSRALSPGHRLFWVAIRLAPGVLALSELPWPALVGQLRRKAGDRSRAKMVGEKGKKSAGERREKEEKKEKEKKKKKGEEVPRVHFLLGDFFKLFKISFLS